MNKKRYMALMQEYENIIENKHFNTHFYNKERLEELKILLNRHLLYHQKKCELAIVSHLRYRMRIFPLRNLRDPFPSGTFELQLMEAKNMYNPLIEKIDHEESIQGYEYEKCYIEWHCGSFNLKQVMIIFVIYGVIMLARWCLGYFGLLP